MTTTRVPRQKSAEIGVDLRSRLARNAKLKKGEIVFLAQTETGIFGLRERVSHLDESRNQLRRVFEKVAHLIEISSHVDEAYTHPASAEGEALLSSEEERLLYESGFRPLGVREAGNLLASSKTAYENLLMESLTVSEAADRLDVSASRIRQKLLAAEPTLYGVKVRNEWLLPAFQFGAKELVPGIEKVVSRLPKDLHPLSVYRWFTSPNPDLTMEASSELLSPLEWLRHGHPIDVVGELAEGL